MQFYGFTLWDLDREFVCGGLCGKQTGASCATSSTPSARPTAARSAPEYMHIQETVQKRWLQDRMEPSRNKQPLDGATKRRILHKLNDAEAFERFLHTKYVGHKRFSLEGAESLIPMLDYLFNEAAGDGVVEGSDRHGPPRPPERAGEHPRQVVRADLPRVRRRHRSRTPARAPAT